MVRDSIREYERKITDEIKGSRDSGCKMWHNITKLRGLMRGGSMKVYEENGNELSMNDIKSEIGNFSKSVDQMHENDVRGEWKDRTREMYGQNDYRDEDRVNVMYENVLEHGRGVLRMRDFRVNIPVSLIEHLSMTRGRIEEVIRRRIS